MVKIAVVVPYFNPVGYHSHAIKLARCLDAFDHVGVDTFLSGAGPDRPGGAEVVFWDERCDFMWHKERLLNQAVRRLPSAYTHIVWADSDVLVGADWPDAVAAAFDRAPVVQCFSTAHYHCLAGTPSRSWVSYLLEGNNAAVGVIWGAQRALFTDGPGLFELALVGGGDSVFASLALREHRSPSAPWIAGYRSMMERRWSRALLAHHDKWAIEVDAWMGSAAAVAADTDITVLEHGTVGDRRYNDRHNLLKHCVPERHLVEDDNHVLHWSVAGSTAVEPDVRAYFFARFEDRELGGGTAC